MPAFTPAETAALAPRIRQNVIPLSLGNPGQDDCAFHETSNSQVRNRSASTSYRVVGAGKYVCAPYTESRDALGQSNEDYFNRSEIGPNSCRDTKVTLSDKGVENSPAYPPCCDCNNVETAGDCQAMQNLCEGWTPGPNSGRAVVHCAGLVVTEAQDQTGVWKLLTPPVWSDFAQDISIKAIDDGVIPSDVEYGCEDFVSNFNVQPIPSQTCISDLALQDIDDDGIIDCCDATIQGLDTVAGSRRSEARLVTRNLMFTGEREASSAAPTNLGTITGVVVGDDAATNLSLGVDDEHLAFDLPNQETGAGTPDGDLPVVFKVGASSYTSATPLKSVRSVYVATSDMSLAGHLIPMSGTSGELFDIEGIADPSVPLELIGETIKTNEFLLPGVVNGLDIGDSGRKIVVSRQNGIEIIDVNGSGRIGNDIPHPPGIQGRRVAAENDPANNLDRYSYMLTWQAGQPGRLRIVDLEQIEAPIFLDTADITGEPKDIEIKAVSEGEANAYVTSVVSESGDCPLGGASAMSGGCEIGLGDPNNPECGPGGGGPGGSSHRRVLLTRITLDRSNGFAGATVEEGDEIELSCISEQGAPGVGELGLALNAARDKAYVLVPDLSQVKVFPINSDGTIVSDPLSVGIISTRPQPRDLVVAKFNGTEMVAIASRGDSLQFPAVERWTATAPFQAEGEFTFLDDDVLPVSITAHPDNLDPDSRIVIVADYGRREIHLIDFSGQSPVLQSLKTVRIPLAVTVQGQ